MLKRFLCLVFMPLLLSGCTGMLTNLTPQQQVRNANNVYPVEVALSSRQQTMRWQSIRPQILVGKETFPMTPTPLMTNRWEGIIAAPAGANILHYKYRFDFDFNAFGKPQQDSMTSPEYTLRIVDQ
jgi:hypothetical protein